MNSKKLVWQAGRFRIDLSEPKIMGIVNVTPDSFSDGGTYSLSVNRTLAHAEQLLKDGADMLDIGGESTRPGAQAVSLEEEWARVSPILEELSRWQVPVSLDTRRHKVMEQALSAGWADIINDVQALEDEGAVELLAEHADIGICLMHMQGLPQNMQDNPQYADVAGQVDAYLKQRLAVCKAAGIDRQRHLHRLPGELPGPGLQRLQMHGLQVTGHGLGQRNREGLLAVAQGREWVVQRRHQVHPVIRGLQSHQR